VYAGPASGRRVVTGTVRLAAGWVSPDGWSCVVAPGELGRRAYTLALPTSESEELIDGGHVADGGGAESSRKRRQGSVGVL
jgi:hypothetical protein